MANLNLTEDLEYLVAMWTRGDHLADSKLLRPDDMPGEPELLREIQAGKDVLELVDAHPDKKLALLQLGGLRNETAYKLALAKVLDQQVKRDIQSQKYDIAGLIDRIDFIRTVQEDTPAPAEDLSGLFLAELQRRVDRKTIPWDSMPTLTEWTAGIRRKALITIAARPGMGKSSIGLQAALGAVDQGEKVLYFPLEMTTEETIERYLAQRQYVPAKEMRRGTVTDTRKLALGLEVMDDMVKSKVFQIFEGVNKLEVIEAIIKAQRPGVVIIDQLSQVTTRQKFGTIREQIVYITRTLKSMAMRNDVAIILMAQLNRGAENEEPTGAHLAESDSILQDSDTIIFLHRIPEGGASGCEWADYMNTFPYLVKVAKQRGGQVGRLKAQFIANQTRFVEI